MSDPVRLRDAGDAFEMSVLAAAKDDVPGGHVGKGVRAALGLGAIAAIGATTSTAAAAGTVATAGTAATAKGATALGVAVVVKWLGVCVVAGVALGATSAYVSQPRRPEPQAASAFVSMPAPVRAAPARPTTMVKTAPSPVPAPATPPAAPAPNATSTLSTPALPVPLATPSSTSASHPATLLSELTPLDSARAALNAGDTSLALDQLNRHDLDYPSGQLAPETLALRIDVYAARHDDAKLVELTQRFLARYPGNPQAARVRSIADAAGNRAGHVPNP